MKKIVTFICITVMFACSNSDDSSGFTGDDNPQGTYVRAIIDGVPYLNDNPDLLANGQLFEINDQFVFGLGGAFISSDLSARSISIVLSGMDFNQVTSGFEATDDNNDFGVLGGILLSDINGFSTEGQSNGNAYIRISSIDKTNRVVSGEFSFIAIDENDLTTTYEVTSGVFNNMSYDIEE